MSANFVNNAESLWKETEEWKKEWQHRKPCKEWKEQRWCKHYVDARYKKFKDRIANLFDFSSNKALSDFLSIGEIYV